MAFFQIQCHINSLGIYDGFCFCQMQEIQSDNKKQERRSCKDREPSSASKLPLAGIIFVSSVLTVGQNFAALLTEVLDVDVSHFHGFPVVNCLKVWL